MDQVLPDHVPEHSGAEQREDEADEARELQRQRTEPGHHVEGVRHQLAERIVRRAELARVVAHCRGGEAGCAPSQEDVD